MKAELDTYALLKTVLDNYADVFRHDARLRKARSYISLALDARNSSSHFDGLMQDRVCGISTRFERCLTRSVQNRR
jgi:hypothetical protein